MFSKIWVQIFDMFWTNWIGIPHARQV